MFSFIGIVCTLLCAYTLFAIFVGPVLADRRLKQQVLETDAASPARIEALVLLAREQAAQDG